MAKIRRLQTAQREQNDVVGIGCAIFGSLWRVAASIPATVACFSLIKQQQKEQMSLGLQFRPFFALLHYVLSTTYAPPSRSQRHEAIFVTDIQFSYRLAKPAISRAFPPFPAISRH
ncbi:MAG TPA: hypothetical protein VI636_09450 [Candidatus Angelobacter sp.]